MNKRIQELFDIATYEPDRFVSGLYHPYIPLQVAGEPLRYSITKYGYQKFAELIVRECVSLMNEEKERYDNPGTYESDEYYIRMKAKAEAFENATSIIKYHFGVE